MCLEKDFKSSPINEIFVSYRGRLTKSERRKEKIQDKIGCRWTWFGIMIGTDHGSLSERCFFRNLPAQIRIFHSTCLCDADLAFTAIICVHVNTVNVPYSATRWKMVIVSYGRK